MTLNHVMNVLFLDQSGQIGGAELSLADLASFYRNRCLVGLLADGAFRQLLEDLEIPVKVLTDRTDRIGRNGMAGSTRRCDRPSKGDRRVRFPSGGGGNCGTASKAARPRSLSFRTHDRSDRSRPTTTLSRF
jgi:hypothetical protein